MNVRLVGTVLASWESKQALVFVKQVIGVGPWVFTVAQGHHHIEMFQGDPWDSYDDHFALGREHSSLQDC